MTLFEDGDWRLIAEGTQTEIQHHCYQPYSGKHWWFYIYDRFCTSCRVAAPDEMIGLKNLHDWDR